MKTNIVLALALAISFTSCAQWGKRIKGNGKVVTIERSVGEYDKIAMGGWFDMEIVSGKEGEITLTGEENLLEHIKTEVKDGKLVVKTKKGVNLKPSNWNKGIIIIVPVSEINGVSLAGSGDVVTKTTLKANEFEAKVSGSGDLELMVETDKLNTALAGSGDIELSGSANEFEAKVSGSGDIKAYDLEADYVSAYVAGSADIKVTATKKLYARVSGSGDISYRGNPEKIDTKVSGSGDITKH